MTTSDLDNGPRSVDTTPELTVGQLAEQAVQTLRALNHLTRPHTGALAHPAQAGDLAAALSCLTGCLPQLLQQLNRWLVSQQRAGHLRVDTSSPLPGPAATIQAVTGQLTHAALSAQQASDALDATHQHLARLTLTTHEHLINTRGDHHPRPHDDDT